MISDFFYYICIMFSIKKYNQKKRIKEIIYKEFEKALKQQDYAKTGILSKRFLKISKNDIF
jgi:hypothetical protein